MENFGPASPVPAQQRRPSWLAGPKIIMDPLSSSRHSSHDLSHDLRGSHIAPDTYKSSPRRRPLNKMLPPEYSSSATGTLLTIDSDSSGTARSMSDFLPITKTPKKLFFRRQVSENKTLIDDSDGNNIAYIDYSDAKEGKRYLNNANGLNCAIIIRQSSSAGGKYIFKICSSKKSVTKKQRKSSETGYYTWAEVKNTGALGGNFALKFYSDTTSTCSDHKHEAKPFGSLFNTRASRGIIITNHKNSTCSKMVTLNNGDRGILVAPDQDLCLMLAYAAIVDEMIENRLR